MTGVQTCALPIFPIVGGPGVDTLFGDAGNDLCIAEHGEKTTGCETVRFFTQPLP